jgi:hypothetical protein
MEKKELLNKEEEYLKEQVYSYRIRNTHLKKQNAYIIISKPHSKKTPEHQQYVLLRRRILRV